MGDIHTKNKEAQYIKEKSSNLIKEITEFIINAIKERAPFDPSMLFYAWYFNENSLTSPLWSVMMEIYEKILSDTKDKNGWKWLKEHFINSLIWFLPHPDVQNEEEKDGNQVTFAKLTGFRNQQFNGKTVEIISYIEKKAKWRVRLLDGGNYLAVKEENLVRNIENKEAEVEQ